MDRDWQDFLTAQGAQLQDCVVQHFGDAAAERLATRDGTVLCDLSQFGVLKVSGEEAQNFLHNLFSSDVKALTPGRAQYSSFNTGKGRALATFLIWQSGTDYYLHLPHSLAASMQKKFSMYVLRAKVKIENVSDELVCLGISGTNSAASVREHVTTQLPRDIYDVEPVSHQGGIGPNPHCTVIRLGDNRFQISTATQYASALWHNLAKGARPAGSPCWDWLNIRAGLPFILPQTQEEFVPQMVNLDLTGHVNFKKGCYPGQEVVARMHYLGKPKRRMYLAHVDGETIPQAGDELFSMEQEGQACGMVVNAAPAPDGGFDLLAVVQVASHDAFPVHLGALTGARLQFQPLPYPIP